MEDSVQKVATAPLREQVQPEAHPVRALRPVYFYLIVSIVFFSDQLSKHWVQTHLIPEGPSRPIFGSAFLLTLTHNTGGAWGLLPRGNPLFIVFAIVAAITLLYAYHRMLHVDLLVGTSFALALGGALGNLTDRLSLGYVVDFFDVRIIQWPIFNIADSAITLGITLLIIHFFVSLWNEKAHPHTPPAVEPAEAPCSEPMQTE